MPVNAQTVFERAIGLMDEGDERTGEMDTPETRPYKARTLGILNLLGQECAAALGEPETWREVTGFDEALPLREELAGMVLPYGLAAQLFLEEAPAQASFFQRRYEELLARWVKGTGAEFEEIVPAYGGLEAHADRGWPEWR